MIIPFPQKIRKLQKQIDELDWKTWKINRHAKALLKAIAAHPNKYLNLQQLLSKAPQAKNSLDRLESLEIIRIRQYNAWVVNNVIVSTEWESPPIEVWTAEAESSGFLVITEIKLILPNLRKIILQGRPKQ